jgi:hypothetical protein
LRLSSRLLPGSRNALGTLLGDNRRAGVPVFDLTLSVPHRRAPRPGYLCDYPNGVDLVVSLLAAPGDLARGVEAILAT